MTSTQPRLLPDDGPPPLPTDADRVYDALAFCQSAWTASRVAELVQLAGWRTQRATTFHPQEVRKLLGELLVQRRAQVDARGQWLPADAAAAFARLRALVQEEAQRARWWPAWRTLMRLDNAWHIDVFDEAGMVSAVRVAVYAGRTLADFEQLARTGRGVSPSHPVVLARALLMPWDAALWSATEPELQLALLRGLMQLPLGDAEAVTVPLWDWLAQQCRERPGSVHGFAVERLALRRLFAGDSAGARSLLPQIDDGAAADALAAAVDIVDGRWEAGAQAYEAALKRQTGEVRKRTQLFAEELQWLYALAQLARQQPAQWAALRKFAAGESGKRAADPYTFWGLWQHAVDQRLGDAPRDGGAFVLAPHVHVPRGGLPLLSHLLLAAWLGHRAPTPAATQALAAELSRAFEASGQPWLALLARRAGALLTDAPPAADDAARPFPIAAAAERWREALNAIVALGAVPDAGARAGAAEASRLVWTVKADRFGRVRRVEPLEQKAGTRGLGKPKPVTLAALQKRADLPAHDQAVLRAVKKAAFGGKLLLDRHLAVQALARHPHVAWADAPEAFVEVVESLPRLEVLSPGAHLQFRIVDPIRPDAQADEDGDDLEDDDDEDDDGDDLDGYGDFERARHGRLRLRAPTPEPVLLLRDDERHARLVRITPAQLRVAELVSQGWQVPADARSEIDAALRVLGTHFQLASDAEAGHEVPASAVLRAELTPQGAGLLLNLVAAPFGDFGPRLPPGQGRERVTTVHQGVTLSTRRDLAAERRALRRLFEAAEAGGSGDGSGGGADASGVALDDADHRWLLDEPAQALALLEVLGGLAPDIVCEWPKGKPLRVRAVQPQALTVKLNGRGDWLALDGELQLDGGEVLRLEALLELARNARSRYVALGEGEFLALADGLRQQLADLRAIALAPAKAGGAARVSPVAALAWAGQWSGQPGAAPPDGDAAWQARVARWAEAQALQPQPPAGWQAELRDYQLAGFRWLTRLATAGFGAVLADDMGLGKTLQTLALLLARAGGGPAIVVAPTSVCGNWLAEAQRFAPGLRLSLYGAVADGSDGEAVAAAEPDDENDESADEGAADAAASTPAGRARRAARQAQLQALGAGDVLVCSYGLLQRDAALLAGRPWHTVVLDEAQAIKNAATARAKAALALPADARVALTGTPIENRLAELWAIMAFANPGLLGPIEVFQQRFAGPIERDGEPEARRRLRRLVSPFLLRRTKAEVLADLPPRTEIVHRIVPGSRERALHEALRREAEESVGRAVAEATGPGAQGQAQFHILAALTRLRRAACDPRLVMPELGLVGAKVQAFEQLALELKAGRHKALVFSQFTDFLALLRERLDAADLRYQYLDGSTPAAQRTQRVNAFQAGDGDFFLVSLKAGGFGLNLTMADYVIIADPWWNPAAEDQASGRAHRIGQQRPVTVYRLVTAGSIEDRIVHLHQHKRSLAEGVLAGQDGGGGTLGAAELMALLRGDAGDSGDEAAGAGR